MRYLDLLDHRPDVSPSRVEEIVRELRVLLQRLTIEMVKAPVEVWTPTLDRYESGERLLRELFGYEGCVHGPDKVCPPNQLVACEFCVESGRWRDG